MEGPTLTDVRKLCNVHVIMSCRPQLLGGQHHSGRQPAVQAAGGGIIVWVWMYVIIIANTLITLTRINYKYNT